MSFKSPKMASCSSKSCLDLISYEEPPSFLYGSVNSRQITRCQFHYSTYSLPQKNQPGISVNGCVTRDESNIRIKIRRHHRMSRGRIHMKLHTCMASEIKPATLPEVPKSMISSTSLAYFSPSEPNIPLYWSGFSAWCIPVWKNNLRLMMIFLSLA